MVHEATHAAADESGVTAMEYALIAALIAIVIVVALTLTGDTLNDFWCWSADWLDWTSERNLEETPTFGESDVCA